MNANVCNASLSSAGDDSTDNGKHNEKIGDVHDLSKKIYSSVYVRPLKKGRYFYFESLLSSAINLFEIQIHSQSMRKYILLPLNSRQYFSRGFCLQKGTFYESDFFLEGEILFTLEHGTTGMNKPK